MAKLPGEAQQLSVPRTTDRIVQLNQSDAVGWEALGRGLQQAGKEIGAEFEKEKRRIDNARVEDAFTQLRNAQLDLTAGENGFQNIKGGDAIKSPLLKDYTNLFQTRMEEIKSKLDNPEQRQAFSLRAGVAQTQFSSDILGHTSQQNQVYQKQNLDSTIATEEDLAAHQWSNPDNVMASLARIKGAVQTYGEANGMDEKTIEAIYREKSAMLHNAVMTQAVDSGNPKYAELWLSTHKDQIDARTAIKAEKLIKDGRQVKLAQDVADDVQVKGMTETQALDHARSKYEGEDRRAIEAEIKFRYAEDKRIIHEDQEQAASDAYRMASEGHGFSEIPTSLKSRMNGQVLEALRSRMEEKARIGSNRIDPVVAATGRQKLLDMAAEDPAKFLAEPILKHVNELDKNDIEQFQRLQYAMKTSDVKTQERLKVRETAMRQAKIAMLAVRLNPNPKEGSKDAERLALFKEELGNELDNIFEEKKRRPTSDEINSTINKLLTKGALHGTGWFSNKQALLFEGMGTKGELSPQFYIPYSQIPEDDKKKLTELYKQNSGGITPSNDVIEEKYNRIVMKKLFNGAK